MILTHKTEIFPTSEQVKQIEINFGMRRFFFNRIIMALKHKYGNLKESIKLIKKSELMDYRSKVLRVKYKWLAAKAHPTYLTHRLKMFNLLSIL